MTTGGTVRASFVGIGPNNNAKNYSKSWEMQPVTDTTVPEEIDTLLQNGATVVEAYAAVTKGLLADSSIAIDLTPTPAVAEAGAYANRAAAISGTIDGNPAKKITIGIQAARDGIFTGNSPESVIVDVADSDVTTYFTVLNAYCLVSDGEVPHEDPVSGYRIDKNFSGKD